MDGPLDDRVDEKSHHERDVARFAVSNGAVSLIGNMAVMTTLVAGAHVPALVASLVSIAVCGLPNVVLGDTMVFRQSPI